MHRHQNWHIHLLLSFISALMLIPFIWVLKTSLSGENIFAYPPSILPEKPHIFYFVDVWYTIPFFRYLVNSIIVSIIVVASNIVLNAMAGYAISREFPGKKIITVLFLSCMMIPFQVTIIPAYLITKEIGALNSYLGMALPLCSTIVCIFIFKASFDSTPKSLIDAARIDGLSELRIIFRILFPLSQSAIATNIILAFIWSWNNFLWPLIIISDQSMQTLPLGLSSFLTVVEDTTGALYAFCIMVLLPGLIMFLLAQKQFIDGLTTGATKG